jgi:hypothetical protein
MFQGSAPEGNSGLVKVVAFRCPGRKILHEVSSSNNEKKKNLFIINAGKALLVLEEFIVDVNRVLTIY